MSRRDEYTFDKPEDGAKVFWSSLADKANPEIGQELAKAEFPKGIEEAKTDKLVRLRKKGETSAHGKKVDANDPNDVSEVSLGRRGFMMFGAASAALAMEGCARRPVEHILPYAKAPEHVLPGVPTWYATARAQRGDAVGMLVESHEGRPTKADGNKDHPWTRGGSDVWTQAGIYDIYDPDRSTTPSKGSRQPNGLYGNHQPATWGEFDTALADILRSSTADGGSKLRILHEPTTSPTFVRLRDAVLQKLPQAKFHTWSSVNDGNVRDGAKLAFGQVVNVVPSYSQASVILSIDSDFLATETGSIRANAEFIAGRKLARGPQDTMNRLYVVEPHFTVTGMNADHRLRLAAQDIEGYLLALANELSNAHKIELGAFKAAMGAAKPAGVPEKWTKAVAKELAANRARSIIVVGSLQPARVHALAHALNAALGNTGHTVNYFPAADPMEAEPVASIKQLVADFDANKVSTLIILGGNPVYDAPADLKLGEKLKAVATTVHLSMHVNETSEVCTWHVPRAHELETWGDHRSLDGTVAIQQPLIAPLYGGRSEIEVLARLSGDPSSKGFALVQATAKGSVQGGTFSRAWNDALKKGVLGSSAKPFGALDARATEVAAAFATAKAPGALSPQAVEVTFAPCPKLYDGRYANNPLLQELPDPVTKVTWDNVALVSPATAKALNVTNGTVIRLTNGNVGSIEVPVWITPGQADNSIALHLGWGRQKAGRFGSQHGFDVGGIRSTTAPWFASGVTVAVLGAGDLDALRPKLKKVGMVAGESPAAGRIRPDDPFEVGKNEYKLSITQEYGAMEGRPVAIDATLDEYRKQPSFPLWPNAERKDKNEKGEVIPVREKGSPDPNVLPLWKKVDYTKVHKWGMAVDMTACTGCNACVIACQVENNVPAVGKEMIWRGREMFWLRIDRYFVGLDENDPQIVFQPVACVQCEEAPCENVCPVNATEHSPEGLNDMAYNRCIGTRYCANNCPYKVRRFNFLNYHSSGGMYEEIAEVERMRYNPNVTVRMRGVMEKCTYCVQRIQEGKIKSKRTGKPIKDGDIRTACQDACPTGAIVFGDLNDPEAQVAKWRAKDRSYRLLAELGTHPRTSYLGKIRNPNPEMA